MKPNYIRIILIMAIVLMGASLYSRWEQSQQDQVSNNNDQRNVQRSSDNNIQDLAKESQQKESTDHKAVVPDNDGKQSNPIQKAQSNNLIKVKTDLYQLSINPNNGAIVDSYLLNYNTSLKDDSPLQLLKNGSYVVQNGFITSLFKQDNIKYQTQQKDYTLGNKNQITVTLKATVNDIDLIKTYTFKKGSYTIKVDQKVVNHTDQSIKGNFFGKILRASTGNEEGSIFDVHSYATYTGTVLSSKEDNYQKESPADIKDAKNNTITVKTDQGWSAMVKHYFISAWVPLEKNKTDFTLFSMTNGTNTYSTGAISPSVTIQPDQSVKSDANLYLGPTIKEQLNQAAPNLSLTIDYGWLWFISEIIFWAMSIIYSFVGNWGVAIILVTLLIKIFFSPLSAKSYRSMGKMRLLQPKIQQLKEQFGDDKQGMTKAMMSLYKSEKVNPLGGCLPLIVQIPVFIALYWVLLESVQLRQAPFIFWIQDLAAKDPYYVLPILMGLSMFVQQKLNPPPPDPMQAKIMMFMPVVFTVMFLNFPSGLVLYWLVNNILSITQQWYIMKGIEKSNKNKYKA